jgi:hypothetical protein
MEKLQDKLANGEEKKEVGKFSWSVIILMISMVLGVLLLKLILE